MTSLISPAPRLNLHFARTLADQIGRRDNSIDQLRLFAALAVVLGHSWHLTLGPEARPPLQDYTVFGFHSLAVHVFFFLSGLLVTESARRHAGSPLRYIAKRTLRIFPALVVNAVAVPIVLVAVGAWTGVGAAEMARYALRLVTLFTIEFAHPGAFAHAPFAGAINGSVWSLRYEILVYGLLIGASLCGALERPWRRAGFLALLLVIVLAGYGVAPHAKGGALYVLAEGRHVLFSFLLGVAAHQFAGRIPLHPVVGIPGIALVVAGAVLGNTMLRETGVIWLTCTATLLLAFPAGRCRKLPHDISYGVYIYSWPLQQLTVFLAATRFGVALSPVALFLICVGPLILIALASWSWIEKPALALAAPRSSRFPRS
ncbi:MAG: acyltransferase family protein [Novosphingobium sp.]